MGGYEEAHTGGGLVGKLGTSLIGDPNRIPYSQINVGQHKSNSCTKSIPWIVPLVLFLGLSALLLLAVTQEESGLILEANPFGIKKLEWNELVFTQLWGYSSCLQFKDQHFPKDVTCRYEKQPAFWSIHGIWPSEAGTKGPSFCTKVKFNATLLEPIRTSLDEYWYEIDSTKEGNYFWSHEWQKHGSCAKELATFDTELKYFSAALDLRQKFDLYSILKDANVVPESVKGGAGYNVDQITNAITTKLGDSALPYVQCLGKKNTISNEMEYYLLAIELCFTTDLQIIPCKQHEHQSVSSFRDNALPCPKDGIIHYLDATL